MSSMREEVNFKFYLVSIKIASVASGYCIRQCSFREDFTVVLKIMGTETN